MQRCIQRHNQQEQKIVGVCALAGAGLGMVLGILFGIAYGSMAYLIVGAAGGAMMGLAVGESNKKFKEYPSS
jgi:outer membrane lipoprotein SlyB